MSKYVEIELKLPHPMQKLLEQMANREGVSLDELVNDILAAELDRLDEHLEEDDSG